MAHKHTSSTVKKGRENGTKSHLKFNGATKIMKMTSFCSQGAQNDLTAEQPDLHNGGDALRAEPD